MARIRTIKPDFWANEKVMSCSRDARLLFVGMWNFADDRGRLTDSARSIKAQVFPGDDDIDSQSVRRWLDELSSNGLVLFYERDGRAYIQVTGWDHQRIDKPRPSKIPPPDSSNVRRPIDDQSDPYLTLSNLSVSNLTGPSDEGSKDAASPELKAIEGGKRRA